MWRAFGIGLMVFGALTAIDDVIDLLVGLVPLAAGVLMTIFGREREA